MIIYCTPYILRNRFGGGLDGELDGEFKLEKWLRLVPFFSLIVPWHGYYFYL